MTKEELYKRNICQETSFYLGGRNGASKILNPKLAYLGVIFTGGCGAGTIFDDSDDYGVEMVVATKYGKKKIVLKISVEDV
jgi:hypothetical protein